MRAKTSRSPLPKTFRHFLDRSLSHVARFSGNPAHFRESVVEHSFYVAYYTTIICQVLKKYKIPIDEAKAIKMALVHDMEETFSGDIRGPFKHYNEEVLGAIRKTNQETIYRVFKHLPKVISDEFIALWQEESEQKSIEAQVVKLSDEISLIAKCYEEMKVGNDFFKHIYKDHVKKLKILKHPWWKRIRKDILPAP